MMTRKLDQFTFGIGDRNTTSCCPTVLVGLTTLLMRILTHDDWDVHSFFVVLRCIAKKELCSPFFFPLLLCPFIPLSLRRRIYLCVTEIFKYALATGQVSEVSGFNERIESWMTTWNTQKMDRRGLYKSVSEVLAKDGKESLALR